MDSRSNWSETSHLPGTKKCDPGGVGWVDPECQRQQQKQQTRLLRDRDQGRTDRTRLVCDQAPDDTDGAQASGPWITHHDLEMAIRQTHFHSLPHPQKITQEKWAQEKLLLGGECVAGCGFYRYDKNGLGGYMCVNDLCWIPDALLAEGKGGYYELFNPMMVQFEGRKVVNGKKMPPVPRWSRRRTVWTGPNHRDMSAIRWRRGLVGNEYISGPPDMFERYLRRQY